MFEEIIVNQFLQQFSNTFLDYFFATITWIGHPVFLLIISALLFWRGKENKSFLLVMIVSVVSLFVYTLKTIIAKPRPDATNIIAPQGFGIIETAQNYSMPSGHGAMTGILFGFFEKNFFGKKIKPMEKWILGTLVLLVLISRLYLGVHYLSDVLVGLLIGYFIAKIGLRFEKVLEKTSFHFSKLREEFLIVGLLLIFFVASIFLMQEQYIVQMIVGYLVGLFLYKQLPENLKQKKENKKVKQKKDYAFVGIGLMILLVLIWWAFSLTGVASQALFFFSGFFITIVWPFFGKSLK